jgi:hypothetical protein
LAFVSLTGFLYFLGLKLFIETSKLNINKQIIFNLILSGLIIYYYFSLPEGRIKDVHIIRFIVLNYLGITLISFSGFLNKDSEISMLQFNVLMVMNLIVTGLYAGILFCGISSAIAAIDVLFNLDFNHKIYGQLWFIIAGIISPLFYFSQIPNDIIKFEYKYPKILKFLVKYILLPLTCIYLLILYAYIIRILFLNEFPKNIVTGFTIGYSITGIITIYLAKPLLEQTQKWLTVFSIYFFRLLPPVLIVMFIAIITRVKEYGFTESRYYVVIVGIWLSIITVYMIFRKNKNFRILPISFFVIGLISLFGPLSSFNISIKSQSKILKQLLIENKILVNNKIYKIDNNIKFEHKKQISSILKYFYDTHSLNKLEFLPEKIVKTNNLNEITKIFGFDYISRWMNKNKQNQWYNYRVNKRNIFEIDSDYDYFFTYNRYLNDDDKDNHSYIEFDNKKLKIILDKTIIVEIDTYDILKTLNDKTGDINSYNIPLKNMVYKYENENYRVLIIFNSIYYKFDKEKQTVDLSNYSFNVLLDKKNK